MKVRIEDDFDLRKIAASGQCFRVREFPDGTFRFVTGKNILYIRELSPSQYEISCSRRKWETIWNDYFDLGRDYRSVRDSIPDSDSYMKAAAKEGKGIRILRQDPWEMLITFIISQRKSIPAIKKSVEMLCSMFGDPVQTNREELFLFPSPSKMHSATERALHDCKLGYRTGYVADAIAVVYTGKLNLKALAQCDDEELFTELKSVKGVGDKVSNCICLFSYGRTSLAPVDTWINKIIDAEYRGKNPFSSYGDAAGIMQQYAFFYAQNHKAAYL